MGIGRKIGLNDDKGYAVAVFIALVVVALVIAGYYIVLRPQPEAYDTIYVLDTNKQAVNYTETLAANRNSSLTVFVGVVNKMGTSANYQVQVKITQNLNIFPIDVPASAVYEKSGLRNGETWETSASITQNQPGDYAVVFELYQQNTDGTYVFTNDYVVLKIQVS